MWHLRLFGGITAERDGIALHRFRAQKYAALLAYLGLSPGRGYGREELIERFWPEADLEAGRMCLRTALSSLRRQLSLLGEVSLFRETDRAMVALNPEALTTDVAEFERLVRRATVVRGTGEEVPFIQEALELYQGALLPGLYDDWVILERERLERIKEGLEERLCTLEATDLPFSHSQAVAKPCVAPKHESPVLLRLPLIASHFHGRSAELTRLTAWLEARARGAEESPLYTVLGPGGMGKTRVATEAARRMASRFSGAVCFVALASCTEPREIPRAVAETLQVDALPGEDAWEQAARLLDNLGPSLLVLDNLEQLLPDAALVVRGILARLPQLSLLITSRQPLLLDGEQVLSLSGLPHGDRVSLFTDRARSVRPDFALTSRNRETISALCTSLEGIPLALELCASWAHLLTPTQMLERLNHRFDLLTARRRDLPMRHRSLHAALEWNCPTEPEVRRFFGALSVFQGSYSLTAAAAVTGVAHPLTLLGQLEERSLLCSESDDLTGEIRFRLLETMREFAAELLTSAETIACRTRHFYYYADLADTLSARLVDQDAEPWFQRLEQEEPNLRLAITHGIEGSESDIVRALHLIQSLGWYWWVRGHKPDRHRWLRRAYERLQSSEVKSPFTRAEILTATSWIMEPPEAEAACRTAIALFEEVANLSATVRLRLHLSYLRDSAGDFTEAESCMLQAIAIMEGHQDRQGAGYAKAELADFYARRGREQEAVATLRECLQIAQDCQNVGSIAKLNVALAGYILKEGNPCEAEHLCRYSVTIFRQKGEIWNLADALHRLATTLIIQGFSEDARPLLEESRDLFACLKDDNNRDKTTHLLQSLSKENS